MLRQQASLGSKHVWGASMLGSKHVGPYGALGNPGCLGATSMMVGRDNEQVVWVELAGAGL